LVCREENYQSCYDEEAAAKIEKEAAIATLASSSSESTTVEATDKKKD
jgi:hypothetical protein